MIEHNVSNRLKLLREKLGLNKTQFARSIHFAKSMVTVNENGTREPSDKFIVSVCHAFSVDEGWLRFGSGAMFRHESGKGQQFQESQISETGKQYAALRSYPEEAQPYIDILIDVLQSNDDVIVAALKQNLEAFKEAVSRGKQLGGGPSKKAVVNGGKM